MIIFYDHFFNLELHCMGVLALGEGEGSLEVLSEKFSLVDDLDEGSVNLLLELETLSSDEVLLEVGLLGVLEEVLLTLLGGLGLRLEEHLLLDTRDVDGADVDLGGGGDDVVGRDATERDTVETEGTGDEEETALEVLEEDHTLVPEATGKDDEDGAGLEGSTEVGSLLGNLLLLVAALAALLEAKGDLHVEAGLALLSGLLLCGL